MASGTYRGAYESSDPRAAAQAKAAGLTIRPDGRWQDANGKILSHSDADSLVEKAGVAQDNAHQEWGTGGIIDRNRNFTGNLLKNIAPVAAFIPGVGPLAAAGLSGAASALGKGISHGSNFGDIAKQGAVGAAEGYGAGKGLQAFQQAGGGLSGAFSGAKSALTAKSGIPGAQSVAGLLGSGGGSGLSGLLGQAGNFLTGNGGLNALGIAQGVNAAALGQKSSDLADMAGKSAVDAWDAKAPLRVAGIQGMLNPKAPDTSGLRQIAARGNPFANRPQSAGGY